MSELDQFFPRGTNGEVLGDDGKPIVHEPPPEKKKRSPRYFGSKGEQWQRARLARVFGTAFAKNKDIPLTINEGQWNERTVYPVNAVDYTGHPTISIPGGDGPFRITVHVEVKTFTGNFTWKQIGKGQARILDLARLAGQLPLIGLCERDGERIIQGWIIPWRRPVDPYYRLGKPELRQLEKVAKRTKWPVAVPWDTAHHLLTTKSTVIEQLGVSDWADIIEAVKGRAGGNFQGKSIRTRDHDLLAAHCYEIVGGGYVGPPWLQSLTVRALETQTEPPF